jgi:hypothetical protein
MGEDGGGEGGSGSTVLWVEEDGRVLATGGGCWRQGESRRSCKFRNGSHLVPLKNTNEEGRCSTMFH